MKLYPERTSLGVASQEPSQAPDQSPIPAPTQDSTLSPTPTPVQAVPTDTAKSQSSLFNNEPAPTAQSAPMTPKIGTTMSQPKPAAPVVPDTLNQQVPEAQAQAALAELKALQDELARLEAMFKQ